MEEKTSLNIKIYLVILISLGLLLFLPDSLMGILHLDKFLKDYGLYLGLIFIVLLASIVSFIFCQLSTVYRRCRIRSSYNNRKIKAIEGLNVDEKLFLYLFFKSEDKVLLLPANIGAVLKLRNYKIIRPLNTIESVERNQVEIEFILEKWADKYIAINHKAYFKDVRKMI